MRKRRRKRDKNRFARHVLLVNDGFLDTTPALSPVGSLPLGQSRKKSSGDASPPLLHEKYTNDRCIEPNPNASGRRFEETNRGLLVLRKHFNSGEGGGLPRPVNTHHHHAAGYNLLLLSRVSLKDSWKE